MDILRQTHIQKIENETNIYTRNPKKQSQLIKQRQSAQKMNPISFLIVLCFVTFSFAAKTSPIQALGTVLPQLNSYYLSPMRIFNDLMKQSLPLVPYQLSSYGSIGRCWSCNLTQIGGLSHQYPSTLPSRIWAVAQIPFFSGIDNALLNQNFNIQYSGNGTVGVYQVGLYNTTWTSGLGGQFVLKSVNQSLFVYIYTTDPTNPVNSITVLPTAFGSSPPTYTTNFLYYLQPFNLLRTCFWQGQNLYNSGKTLQIWANRTLISSSTQVSSTGVALEHILQLQTAAKSTLWPCIPDSADSNYVVQMATLIANSRNQSNIMYLEFGNVYTLMNNFTDITTAPVFDNFMATYGYSYRNKILFTANYKDVQYYINAMGMRTSPPINFTYIDAIGFEPNFGILSISQAWNATVDQIKSNLTHYMLQYQVTVNKAYQLAKMNGTDLVTFSGGPYIKTPRFAYLWMNKTNSTYAANATLELNLANTLYDLNQNDLWVGEFYLQWLGRLTSIGVKTVLFSQLTGLGAAPNTTEIDFVPLVPFLNTTTHVYTALNQSVFNNRTTSLPLYGTVPSNPSVCNPPCLWGDCVLNTCACYAYYSGSSCNVYTAPTNRSKLGVNLQGVSYWTTQHPFVDFHREGSSWVYFIINQGWSSGTAYQSQVPLDQNGYPTYLPPGITVGTLMSRDVLTHYDAGNYTVLYDGDGTLNFGMFDVTNVVFGIGKCTLTVVPSTNMNNGILVTIERTNPNNHIRNIRIIRPGYEQIWWTQTFSPLMLQKLAPYSTLRFMDWTNTNSQTDTAWNTRTQTSYRTYTGNGVAWEETIHLANLLGKDMWINIPYLATNDYITQLATLVLNTLEPHLKVYVQYSNQIWGTGFIGGQWVQTQGVQYYSNASRITTLNNATDPTQARFCYYSLITQNISTLWRNVWSSPADSTRLKIVISTQAVNADTTKRILACENAYQMVDFVAIAPYISVSLNDSMTQTQVFTLLNAQLNTIATSLQQHATYTKLYNLPLGCYQAGQGLLGSTTVTTQLAESVQDDSRMAALYTSYYKMLFNNSVVLANQYTDTGIQSRYGSWGLHQFADMRLNASYKWQGLQAYITEQNTPIAPLIFAQCNNNCNGNGLWSFGHCSCYNDFTGPNCSIPRFIDYVDCGYLCTFNQGTCTLLNVVGITRYFGCTCYPGYTGNACAIPICPGNCNYNGRCTAPNTCTCFRGKMGVNCTIDCGCGGHGTCNNDSTCLCDSGYIFNTTSKRCEYQCLGQASANCYGPNLLNCPLGCYQGTCTNSTCVCWPGFSGTNCTTPATVNYPNTSLGINLAGLSYWSTQHLFKDYNKQSSQWIPQYYPNYFNSSIQYTWNTSAYFPTQPNGYPSSLYANQSVGKLLLRDIKLKYPSINQTNDYVLLYDGDGVLNLGMDASAYEYSAGRIRFKVTPSTVLNNGVYLNLIAINPANPLRNIRVVLSRDEYNYQKDLLSQNFMTFIAQFTTIRFMDLMATNGNPVSEWNQTTRSDADTQAQPAGISMLLLAKIVNRTGRNLWINVPHQASNNYILELATFLFNNIPSNRTIYVQYSNQVWNTFFAQGQYAVAQAAQLNLANYHKFYAQRSLYIFNVFTSVFGGNSRLQFVVSYQAVSQWVADQIFTGTGLIGVANIVAAAPYYDCDNIGNSTNTAYFAGLTPADVINRCNSSFASLTPILNISNIVAQKYNLSMATYESGTSISETDTIYSGNENPQATANFIKANDSPDMYSVYKQLLFLYKKNNYTRNAPMNIFSSIGLPSKYGSWGVLDYLDQVNEVPTHPKFQAIKDFNQGF